MSLASNDRRTTLTATGGQTVFTSDFKLYDTDEVAVYQEGVLLDPADYTVGAITGSTFTITLDTGATVSDEIIIEGNRAPISEAAFSTGGDFRATEVNTLLDKLGAQDQELRRDIDDIDAVIGDIANGEEILTGDLAAGDIPVAEDADGTLTPSVISQSSGALTIESAAALDTATIGSNLVDGTGWTSTNWTGDFASGFDHSTGNTSALSRAVTYTAGQRYVVQFRIEGEASPAGSFTVSFGGHTTVTYSGGVFSGDTSDRDYAVGFIPANNTDPISFTPTSTFNGTISNISVKNVSAARSPILRVMDGSSVSSFEIRPTDESLGFTFIGKNAGRYIVANQQDGGTGGLTAVGDGAMASAISGKMSVAVGLNALNTNAHPNQDVAIGYNALGAAITGSYSNVAIGANALPALTSGVLNTAVGTDAGLAVTTGGHNTYMGVHAGVANVTGEYNTAIGENALYSGTGTANVGLGFAAGTNLVAGNGNTIIGRGAGISLTSGNNNLLIGTLNYNADVPAASTSNYLNIGNAITGDLATGNITIAGTITASNLSGVSVGAGTSGGVPYYSSTSALSSSAALGADYIMLGGGVGGAPSTNQALSFNAGVLQTGVNDTTASALYVYGGNSTTGGAIRIYNGASNDTTVEYWAISAADQLIIGSNLANYIEVANNGNVTIGTIVSGTWNGTAITGTYGGTGVNNGSNTITVGGNLNTAAAFTTSGANALTLTTTGTTNVTLPTTGTLVNSAVTTLSSLTSVGTIGTGVWQGTAVAVGYGGTGLASGTSGGVPYFSASNTMASSAALAANALVRGGGAGVAPSTSANLTFDGSTLALTGAQTISSTLGVTGITTLTGGYLVGNASSLAFTVSTASTTVQNFSNTDTSGVFSAAYALHAGVAGGANIALIKGRGTQASPTVVSSGDTLGSINFYGFDGTDYERAAIIRAVVDTTPGSNDMPGRLVFLTTPDGSVTATEAARFDSAQMLTLGVSTTTQGKLFVTRGTGTNQPAYVRLESKGGTSYYFFVTDAGVLRVHTAAPTADSDGTAV